MGSEKDDQIIMAVPVDVLFGADGEHHFQGFRPHHEQDYESLILRHGGYMRRGDIETDFTIKHPIGYSVVLNPFTKQIFAYLRSGDHAEGRLAGKLSIGLGGHVERGVDSTAPNPMETSRDRELSEEVRFVGGTIKRIHLLGYLNDDRDDVGKVHFGFLNVAITDAQKVAPGDPEVAYGELMTFEELAEKCAQPKVMFEGWSQIALPHVKEFLAGYTP